MEQPELVMKFLTVLGAPLIQGGVGCRATLCNHCLEFGADDGRLIFTTTGADVSGPSTDINKPIHLPAENFYINNWRPG